MSAEKKPPAVNPNSKGGNMIEDANLPPHMDVLRDLRKETDTVVLSFSGGKDSLCCWVELLKAGFKVVPYHMEIVPGLKFIEDYMQYCEKKFDAHIYRCLHPALYNWLNTLVCIPPPYREAIGVMDLPLFEMYDVEQGILRTAGLPKTTWVAIGTTLYDSSLRRKALLANRGLDRKKHRVFPIFDMKKQDKIDCLKGAGVLLPVDYEMFGRSFDGIRSWYVQPIKDRFPEDYERIKTFFPMIDVELARKEFLDASRRKA